MVGGRDGGGEVYEILQSTMMIFIKVLFIGCKCLPTTVVLKGRMPTYLQL